MTTIEILAAQASLKKMEQNGYFDICVIDNILKISGGVPNGRDHQVLRMLHCVHFKDMPSELLKELPHIVHRVLGSPALSLDCFSVDISDSNTDNTRALSLRR
jgi:hypothetical protein